MGIFDVIVVWVLPVMEIEVGELPTVAGALVPRDKSC